MPISIPMSRPYLSSLGQLARGGAWRLTLPHSHDHDLFVWTTRGQGIVHVTGRRRGLGVHNALLVPARSMIAIDLGKQGFAQAMTVPAGTVAGFPREPVLLRVRDVQMQRAVANAGSAERRSRSRTRTTQICRGPFPTTSAIFRTFLPWPRWKMTNWFSLHHNSSLNLEAVTSGLRCLADRRTMGGLRLDSPSLTGRARSIKAPSSCSWTLERLGSKRFRTGNSAIRRPIVPGRHCIFRILSISTASSTASFSPLLASPGVRLPVFAVAPPS